MDGNHPRLSIFRNKLAVVMKAYHSLWDTLAKGPHEDVIDTIWKEKKNKKSLKKLIPLLVKLDDYSLLITNKQPNIRTISLGSGEKPDKEKEATKSDKTNGDEGAEKGKAAADKHFSGVREITVSDRCKKEEEATKSKKEARSEANKSTPLLIATITGFSTIVKEILEQHPQTAELVNENERNILHLAIKNRQKDIVDLIQSEPKLMSRLNKRIDHNGNTILHQAADRTYYSIAVSQKVIGPAMELQKELLWKQRIKELLPPHYIMHHNDNDQTAEELFNAGHDDLLKSAQDWVKETAQSCSTVAVLVATVVFAAAYAIPGGNNEQSGRPVFENNPLFLLFTSMDVLAIACSLSSVAFFLSVLSSPLEYPNFVKSIPRKVMIGFVFLFVSMATTMLAFAATILLLIRIEKKWTKSLLYPIAFFPVPLFGLLQFPMYQFVKIMFLTMDAWFFKPLFRFFGFRKKKLIWRKINAH
ncbi:ankyrin repeat-containing protein [Pyrus ussuriensis x Pyrus communis]|uniref:Ankyrin repeat-containing protein n=1 Tax=Pyrus ussuriensis x Pyrus communis TaxID=2448454 RepID=A0A5N5IDA6_9ROSA|nr:ankyrin repeat-containing protein [Pyrus ussuriensis x Pyrus communis]